MEYEIKAPVCLSQLQNNTFTTNVIDYLSHNLTSGTAKNSFQGTAISINQHTNNSPNNNTSKVGDQRLVDHNKSNCSVMINQS